MHLSYWRFLWPFLVLLASFVFFFEFIADVGGGGELLSSPPETPTPAATPTPTPTPTVADPFPDTGHLPPASVQRVIGGDTLVVRFQGETLRVRYAGVDTPGMDEPCFEEAQEANKRLVEGRIVRLLADVPDADNDGVLLRYAFLEDGRSVEASLVAHGMARARRQGIYQDYFISLEEAAKAGQAGCLWSP